MTRFCIAIIALLISENCISQHGYWQQKVDYEMDIVFDHEKHQFSGEQNLVYTNNSPDTLNRIFFHLYFNAFQPGSSMDVRSRTVSDPDPRIKDRIQHLTDSEIGYHKIQSISQEGKPVSYTINGTVMSVELSTPILPNETSSFHLEFESQVPVQIRRSGRNNSEGVDYTMTQWYPKLAEYDVDGWHTDPYVCREFHGVFGTFNVNITIDSKYVIGGTGVLQNPELTQSKSEFKIWQFKAENVHDFAWAADPDFVRSSAFTSNGTELNFYHLNDTAINDNWHRLEEQTVKLFEIMNERFGEYPYPQFSVIQAGDGGMEYPMCTMISGTGSFGGLVSVTVHEAIHNWYYGVLATNELKYPWMDEGFTTFAQNIVLDLLGKRNSANPHKRSYESYIKHVTNKTEEPLTTHADHYEINASYGVASYSKGCVFLSQLEYILGKDVFYKGMKSYFNEWKFKHPTPTDFKRVMEKTSGLELDWYFEGWIGTTKQIDYSIASVFTEGENTQIVIEKKGGLHLPIEITLQLEEAQETYYIPIERMRGAKKDSTLIHKTAWPWAFPSYSLIVERKLSEIKRIEIDQQQRTADVDLTNNVSPMVDPTESFKADH
ncbi:M1 family metallopeptidase [Salibacteraceae bacterium]|nr:M1 family metallopeptidase [Salibacteraceae bacterium]